MISKKFKSFCKLYARDGKKGDRKEAVSTYYFETEIFISISCFHHESRHAPGLTYEKHICPLDQRLGHEIEPGGDG